MNWANWLLSGFAGTVILTTLMSGGQGLGLTRMNMPYMLGTIFTPSRDRAKVYGVVVHLLNGWLFSLVYVAAFHVTHIFTWWFGAGIGIVHAAFVLAVAMPVFPGMHPRMASEIGGPTVVRQLEPPGFLGRNYGARTPISVLIAHVVFGIVLGLGYSPAAVAIAPVVSVPGGRGAGVADRWRQRAGQRRRPGHDEVAGEGDRRRTRAGRAPAC